MFCILKLLSKWNVWNTTWRGFDVNWSVHFVLARIISHQYIAMRLAAIMSSFWYRNLFQWCGKYRWFLPCFLAGFNIAFALDTNIIAFKHIGWISCSLTWIYFTCTMVWRGCTAETDGVFSSWRSQHSTGNRNNNYYTWKSSQLNIGPCWDKCL